VELKTQAQQEIGVEKEREKKKNMGALGFEPRAFSNAPFTSAMNDPLSDVVSASSFQLGTYGKLWMCTAKSMRWVLVYRVK
jgi:hypothetical protein